VEKPDLTGLLIVGGHVMYVDPTAGQHQALVTAIWGNPKDAPLINVVFVDPDENRHDSYGRQISRSTSLCHRSASNVHGNYYMLPGDTPNPIVQPTAQ
jgi:hypothetical protein